jgi:hypothetical protein
MPDRDTCFIPKFQETKNIALLNGGMFCIRNLWFCSQNIIQESVFLKLFLSYRWKINEIIAVRRVEKLIFLEFWKNMAIVERIGWDRVVGEVCFSQGVYLCTPS